MFQFSDDIDEDLLEDVLSISANQIAHEEETNNSVSSLNINNTESCHPDENESRITLKDFDDDDDLIFSALENGNDSLSENQNVSHVSSSLQRTSALSAEVVHISQIAHHVISPFVTKHKSTSFTESPNAAKYAKIEYERKFPGPAGLIAKKSRENLTEPGEKFVPSENLQFEVHHTGDSLFDSSPSWQQLLNDVGLKSNKLRDTVKEFTISNVKRLNLVKHTSWKIPIFAAVIYNLDSSVCDPSVTLKDPSGEIKGTLHKDLWEQYNHLLLAGSTLLLRQVSVMSMINSRKLYLNVTTNNIVTIYTPPTNDKSLIVTHITTVSESNLVNEAKTEKMTQLANVPAPNVISTISSRENTKARSNADLLNLIKNSNTTNSNSSCSLPQVPSPKNSLPGFHTNSMSIDDSFTNVTTVGNSPETKSREEKNSSLILNELEGLDTDSLFDDF